MNKTAGIFTKEPKPQKATDILFEAEKNMSKIKLNLMQ